MHKNIKILPPPKTTALRLMQIREIMLTTMKTILQKENRSSRPVRRIQGEEKTLDSDSGLLCITGVTYEQLLVLFQLIFFLYNEMSTYR